MGKIKEITLEEAKDIADRYFHCAARIHNCAKPCKLCKYDYSDKDIKRAMNFILEIREQK